MDENTQEQTENLENAEVAELDDQDLEDAAGGGNTNCVCITREN